MHWTRILITPFAKKIVEIPKVVFTKTLEESTWNNTTLAKENLAEEIADLKKQNGKDIAVVGGEGFVSSLIKEGLIDEYHLIVNPTAIGSGMTIFNSLDGMQRFSPIASKLYSGGKTVLSYNPQIIDHNRFVESVWVTSLKTNLTACVVGCD